MMAAATMPHNMDELLGSVIDTSTVHEIVSPNLHKILPHVQQKFIRMRKQEKPVALMKLVKTELDKRRPVIVFTNKTVTSDFVEILLKDNSIPAVALHGDLLKVIRDGQFEKFQSGDINVLVTTDVTSRGLDTKRVRFTKKFNKWIFKMLRTFFYFFIRLGVSCRQLRFSQIRRGLHPSMWTHWSGRQC